MTARDPAAARFAAIQAVRLLGVACVIGGMIVVSGKSPLPELAGYFLLAVGLVDVFVIPPVLVRRWRTPK